MPFEPTFTITPKIARSLMRIEAARQAVEDLPITPSVLATLRATSRLFSTHYSTMIEGNRLTQEQVGKVIGKHQHFPGRERDEKEVLGYYAALAKAEAIAASRQRGHGIAHPAPPRPGDGWWTQDRQTNALPRRPERHPRQPEPWHRLYAAGGQGCSEANAGAGGMDQAPGAAKACHARFAPESLITSSPLSIPIMTAMAERHGY